MDAASFMILLISGVAGVLEGAGELDPGSLLGTVTTFGVAGTGLAGAGVTGPGAVGVGCTGGAA